MEAIQISVVIPTCDRKERLLSLLQNLNRSLFRVNEVIIVDAGDDRLSPDQLSAFNNLPVQYLRAEKSVCIQRNTGIQKASMPWVFLCDDDMELPDDYLKVLTEYVQANPGTGAVTGLWMEKDKEGWKAGFPVLSSRGLWWRYFFNLGIWGEIRVSGKNPVTRRIKKYYSRRGNHITKAGWPVNTDFSSSDVTFPVYSLGASLVKREWLLLSPFDEVLDRHGIGDHYGVLADLPVPGIRVLGKVMVYHHKEPLNRLEKPLQYYRRVLALDYFAKTKPHLKFVKRHRLLWSLVGNLLIFIRRGEGLLCRATLRLMGVILFGRNPYLKAKREGRKIIEPGSKK